MEADILLIEDEAEFADYLKRGLTYAGYRVRLAHSAEEGLEKFDQDRHRLLILDVMLPGMNGMDACRRIREKGFTGPILMLTARNAIPDRVLGLDSGADDYL
ncbi:MAG TPA: response regulator, partial [Anaerolineales bacterium]|nr:response regulator [Anaerolineales bacterium]